MKNLILTLAILIVTGCNQGEDMATIGEEVSLELVSTNVTDDTAEYDNTAFYIEDTIVEQDGELHVVIYDGIILYMPSYDLVIGEYVHNGAGLIYNVIRAHIDEAPTTTNTLDYNPHKANVKTIKYFNYIIGFPASNEYTYYPLFPNTYPRETYAYTQDDDILWTETKTVIKTSGGTPTVTTMDVLVYPSYREGMPSGSFVIHGGDLLKVEIASDSFISLNNYHYFSMAYGEKPYIVTYISPLNQHKLLDGTNNTPSISISPMTYVFKGTEEFNSFTLAKVLASSLIYTFTLPIGDVNYALWLDGVSVLSGGNGIVKTDTVLIDCKRDKDGVLSLYPTTVPFYADQQMPIDSTVEIELTHDSDVKLGDFTLNNSVSDGMTKLVFSHGIQDWNDYTPNVWGNIPEGIKAVVTKFNITMLVDIHNYDYLVSFHESLVRKFVMVDGSDSEGATPDSTNIFGSLTRRVKITNVTSSTVEKDGDIDEKAVITLAVQEIV